MSTSVVDNKKENRLAAFRTLVRAHLHCTTGMRSQARHGSSLLESSARMQGFLKSPSRAEMGSGVSSRNLPLPQQSASRLPQQQ